MKHFNFKTLAMGAAIVGSLFATNVYAEKDSHGLDEKTLCTLKNGGRYLALKGFNDGAGWGDFGGPNGGNGRIYLERVGENKYIVGGQGLFITAIADGVNPTAGAKADAIAFTVTGDTQSGLAFEHNGVYLRKGTGTTSEQKWEFNVFGDNGYKAQLDGGQQINLGDNRYSVVMFPFQVSAPEGKTLYKYSTTDAEGNLVFAPIAAGEALPGGEPGLYKTASNDGDFRLNIVFTDGEKGSAITEYVDQPKTMGGVFTGFYSKPGINANGADFMLGLKGGAIGFYKDLANTNNCNDGNYKQDQTNIAYITANEDVNYYALEEVDGNLVFKPAYRIEKYINDCVALAADLTAMKAKEGTGEGQYNVTEEVAGTEGWAIWNDLASYDAADDAKYAEISEADAKALVAALKALAEAVEATKVAYDLSFLADVNIVTLQWNGGGRYAGCNGGSGWDNLNNTFGSPNGGNGRIGIVKKADGTWALGTQGKYLAVSADGKMSNAASLEEATGLTITKSTDGELVFQTADGWYLTGQNFGTNKNIGDADGYKLNSWGDYQIAKQDLFDAGNGVFIAPICLPYTVTVPEGAAAYTVTVENGALVTTAVTEVPGGTPVICVGTGGQVWMNIPQENQVYVIPALNTTALTGWYTKSSTDYIFDIKDGVAGFYGNTSSIGNATDVNKAGIAEDIATQLNAVKFVWDAENKQLVVDTDASSIVAKAVEAVAKLVEMKANEGTQPGQYNVTEEVVGAEGMAIWNGLEKYDAADDAVYTGMTVNDVKALIAKLNKLATDVDACKVVYDLGLADVNIVTLQWPGKRYVGMNGGERTWEAPYSMGNPHNGNGRVGIVKRADGKWAVACQGLYIVKDGDESLSAERVTNPDEATGFNISRTSENGLTFVTDDGWYLYFPDVDMRITNDASKITDDFKVNTFNNYAYSKQDFTQVAEGLYAAAICVPFKVQKPVIEGVDNHFYTITVVDGKVVTTEVNEVGAGVPFIHVSNVDNDDVERLIIPQENQAYAAPSTETAMKGWYQQYQYGTDETPKNFYFAVRDGSFGFYEDATPANVNQAAISGAVAAELGAAFFSWNAETKQLDAATNTAQVTYNVSYNGVIVKSETVKGVIGEKYSVPSSLAADYTTFSFSSEDSTKVIEGDVEVTVYATWNTPFEVSTSVADAHWYNLGIRDQHWVRVHDREPYQPIVWGDVNNDILRTAEYQWAFMGNPYELYIYNKSTAEQTLGVVNDDYVKMLDGQNAWELLENGADAFVLRAPGTADWYLNQNGGSGNNRDLKFWKNGGGRRDGGSTFKVYEVPLLVNEAIALFMELNAVVADVVQNPDNYEYTYTEADNALLDGGYEAAEAYEGKSDEEVKALMVEFQALINRLKDARPTGLKALNIVTLKWNNYVTLTAEGKWAGIIAPNDAYGKIAIIKKEAGYLLSAQGLFVKVNEDMTVSMVAEDEATVLTIKGTVADGLTISANGLYLSGEDLSVMTERPTQTYQVNAYANTNLIATKEEMVEAATKLYMGDFCFPFSVTKPVNEKEHHLYTLKVADLDSEEEVNIIEMVEVDTVMAGVPFIYITNSKDDAETRLVILGDSVQTYAATPATEGLLNGYYMIPAAVEGNFYFGEEDWYYGYYNTVKPQSANGAYITAAAAEELTAVKFWFDDEDLVFKATNADGVDLTTGISAVVNNAANGAIYNLQGVRVAQPTKGIYIINGQKVVVK